MTIKLFLVRSYKIHLFHAVKTVLRKTEYQKKTLYHGN